MDITLYSRFVVFAFLVFSADHLHYIDLAGLRIVHDIDIFPEHPECRPYSLAMGELDPRLYLSVGPRGFIMRIYASRRVLYPIALFLSCLNGHIAIAHDHVSARGVVLELFVAPSVRSCFEIPLALVERIPVKLIRPNQIPFIRGFFRGTVSVVARA